MRTYKYKLWNHRKGVGIMKRYPKYKEGGVEWIGKMPSHWQTTAIKHLTKNLDGKRIPLSGEVRADQKRIYPYYGANGIIDYVEDYIFEGEHILIGEDGAPFFDKTREVSLLASGKFWVNNHCHILKNIGTSDARFIVHCLNSVDYFEYITGSTRDKLTQADLNRIKIPMPNYEEQAQIANFLDRKTGQIDELTRIKERQVELLQEQRTALINQAVTKGLNQNVKMKPSGMEWIGKIPKHWGIRKIKHIATLVSEKSTPETDAIKISPENVESETGKVLDFYSSYDSIGVKFQAGDVLFNKLRVYLSKVIFAEYSGYSLGEMIVIRTSLQQMGKYLFYLMLSSRFIEYCNSISEGVKMPRTDVNDILNAHIPLTPYQEQAQIVKFLDRKTQQIDELIATEQRKIELLKEYRQSLISEVVTGKIDVRSEA